MNKLICALAATALLSLTAPAFACTYGASASAEAPGETMQLAQAMEKKAEKKAHKEKTEMNKQAAEANKQAAKEKSAAKDKAAKQADKMKN